MGARHATWEALERLAVPTWVVSGAVAPMGPSAFARRIAERIPGATYVEWPDLGHFAPLQDPARIARLVADVALGHAAPGGTPPHGAAPRT
jgi:3-oxoadipate enol-lactonase/4-carboxymuconolactone decarboxylase